MENTKQNEAVDERYPNTPIGIVRSRDAFLRDLPKLLANPKYDRWSVGYCGDERFALAESLTEVRRECERRGLPRDTWYIGCICPHGGDDEEVEFGFYEFDEIEDMDNAPFPDGTKANP